MAEPVQCAYHVVTHPLVDGLGRPREERVQARECRVDLDVCPLKVHAAHVPLGTNGTGQRMRLDLQAKGSHEALEDRGGAQCGVVLRWADAWMCSQTEEQQQRPSRRGCHPLAAAYRDKGGVMMTKIARSLAWRACCSTGKKTPGENVDPRT